MKNTKFSLLVLLLLLPSVMMAQLQRSETFKNKYQLKEVVILSRYNIRTSLSDAFKKEALNAYDAIR